MARCEPHRLSSGGFLVADETCYSGQSCPSRSEDPLLCPRRPLDYPALVSGHFLPQPWPARLASSPLPPKRAGLLSPIVGGKRPIAIPIYTHPQRLAIFGTGRFVLRAYRTFKIEMRNGWRFRYTAQSSRSIQQDHSKLGLVIELILVL